jgi:hypothetical protein
MCILGDRRGLGWHVARITAYVRLRPRMQRYSVQRLGRHTWAAALARA